MKIKFTVEFKGGNTDGDERLAYKMATELSKYSRVKRVIIEEYQYENKDTRYSTKKSK